MDENEWIAFRCCYCSSGLDSILSYILHTSSSWAAQTSFGGVVAEPSASSKLFNQSIVLVSELHWSKTTCPNPKRPENVQLIQINLKQNWFLPKVTNSTVIDIHIYNDGHIHPCVFVLFLLIKTACLIKFFFSPLEQQVGQVMNDKHILLTLSFALLLYLK